MKRTTLMIFLFLSVVSYTLISAFVPAENAKFSPGYFIINANAEYTVALPSGADFNQTKNGNYKVSENLSMLAGEVVIAFEYSNGRYFCFDPNGRMVVFKERIV